MKIPDAYCKNPGSLGANLLSVGVRILLGTNLGLPFLFRAILLALFQKLECNIFSSNSCEISIFLFSNASFQGDSL